MNARVSPRDNWPADAGTGGAMAGSPLLFRGLLPASVSLAQMDPRQADPTGIDPFERLQITRAVDSRRREYAAGRLLARSLLRGRGLADCSLLNGSDRAPVWPPTMVGSISHCSTLCVVAVASAADVFGLGIDVEHAEPLPPDIAARVVSLPERQSIARLPKPLRELADRLIFSAKEASYKALYPNLRRFLDFGDLRIELSEAGSFVVTATVQVALSAAPLHGRFRVENGYLATAVAFAT